MDYTVKQLAALAGVSSRTLRYYDSIGLLSPAKVTGAGYRIYTTAEADLLQQILLYRSLGFPLKTIRRLVQDPGADRLAALEAQLLLLQARRREFDLLIDTVRKTIESEKGGLLMKDSEKFAGFKREKLAANERLYGEEIRRKYGDEAVEAAGRRFGALSETAFREMERLNEALLRGLEAAVQENASPASETGLRLAKLHRQWLEFTMPECSGEMQRQLCKMYLCDSRFTGYYNRNREGCAQFLHDAVEALHK